jgi:pyruvate/2-oxoglutarate dehydrogenase complex dihydrolipoamide dehydrogenase (E3) component
MLQDERIEIICNAKVSATRSAANGVAIELADRTVEASSLLVATGRTPNTDNLGLETIGVALDERGYVLVNDRLETQANNVWALGDINRRGAFTHTSYHDFELVADNLEGAGRSVANRPATYSMFTDPPLAHVGIYERDARALAAQGRNISMASIDMANVSRAKEESETIGCIKIFIDEDRDRFLGMGMLGINADEIMHIFANLMATDGSVAKVRNTLPAHPTVAEFIPTILAGRKKL